MAYADSEPADLTPGDCQFNSSWTIFLQIGQVTIKGTQKTFIPQRDLCYTTKIVTIQYYSALIILALLFSVTPSDTAELFRWEDEQGVVHFTDNQHNIPKQYMDKVTRIKSLAPSKPPENPIFPNRVSIPLKAIGTAAVVQVKLNDRALGNFIVDTGASYTVISKATARELAINLKKNVKNVRLQTANGFIDAQLVTLDSIEVGGMRVGNLMAAVHDFSQDGSVSGLLGLNFLRHFRIDIDTENRVMVLEKK